MFICKFPNIVCPAFVTLHAVNKQHKVVGCCLQHNHALHRAHDRYYVCNRKLTTEQEAHVMNIMEIFCNVEEVCSSAMENFNRLVTLCDINSIRRRFRLMDGRNGVVGRVKVLLR